MAVIVNPTSNMTQKEHAFANCWRLSALDVSFSKNYHFHSGSIYTGTGWEESDPN
jgi:hypothetical protein